MTHKANRLNLLTSISTRTQLLALIAIIGEGLFIYAFKSVQQDEKFGVAAMALVFLITIFTSIVYLELNSSKGFGATPETDKKASKFLNNLVLAALETVCRAVSLPADPGAIGIRVFIFKKEDDELVCKYSWSQNPVEEVVNKLKFKISQNSSREVAVVKSALNRKIEESEIKPISENLKLNGEVVGDIDNQLTYVVAAPIYSSDNKIWGIVDFDTSSEVGMETLQKDSSKATMFKLASLLSTMFDIEMNQSD
ncbi:hypothetical protein [Reichenbachiella sp.]|uniref:hypothetical protein n=1 Tax=Reichenbachiella sp. TaxID=2184521 RepID=UPI003B5C63A2